jgi:hypothetical protein
LRSDMKRFLILVGILVGVVAVLSGSNAVAADLFPWWFHTRPKPVLLEDHAPAAPAPAVSRTPVRAVSHSNLPDNRRERQAQESKSPKSRLTEFFTSSWRTGPQRSK